MKRLGCVGSLLLVLALATPARGQLAQPTTARVSAPFRYAGYSRAEFAGHTSASTYVPLSDGERLAVDVFLPADGPPRSAFPVILYYTPYQRATIDPATGAVQDRMSRPEGPFFTSRGYAVVVADMRGTGASSGWLLDFMPRLAEDGRELVDWIAAQAWCDGNVGMAGGSYLGWAQTATASRAPPALKAIVPSVIPLEGYTGEVYPGGIFVQGFLELWSGAMYSRHRNHWIPAEGILPTKPVVDEDGDGELVDEIPVDANGDGSFLDEGFPPVYRDGAERRHVYYQATRAHERNLDYASWARDLVFIDTPSPLGFTLYEMGPNAHVDGLARSGIPIYHIGGWFDGFARGSFELWATLDATNPSKLLMAPSYHGYASGPFWEHLGESPLRIGVDVLVEHLRFFDRWLKSIPNGIDAEPPLHLYVMNGEGWRFETEWPLARELRTPFFLGSDGRLTRERGPDGADRYPADFTHDSRYGTNRGNRWLGIGGKSPDALPVRTRLDDQCLTYTSTPLVGDTEVTGHPQVRLWISSTTAWGDVFVYLEDVDDAGRALLVTEGMLRAGFAGLHDNDRIVARARRGAGRMRVLPRLPWHGFEREDWVEGILAEGAVVELRFDLQPTAWVFRRGHRIRLTVAAADFPTFRLHPRLSPANDPAAPDNVVPTLTLYRDAERPSHVELPVIPPRIGETPDPPQLR